MSVKILVGDVFAKLAELPDESVHCVVTSPPYWGLRDYGVSGQIGLEPTLCEHLETMVKVFAEMRRVMRPDATLWLNYGDCYASSPAGKTHEKADGRVINPNDDRTFTQKPFSTVGGVLKPKDLCMIPNRLAIALQEDGWWVRSEIIWAKPNPMPESAKDRPTSSHEKIWLLSKSARYYYDAEAVREPVESGEMQAGFRGKGSQYTNNQSFANSANISAQTAGIPRGTTTARNLRNVWNIATAPFPDAHFATFPPQLAETCIKAGTSEKGVCAECGAPWVRDLERPFVGEYRSGDRVAQLKKGDHRNLPHDYERAKTIGWSRSCACTANAAPATVLDPFGGSGTTGLVADRLGRSAILIELNPEYAAMAERRIKGDSPLFADVAAD